MYNFELAEQSELPFEIRVDIPYCRKYRVARIRRLENQRLLCARSLRSWREVARHPEDMRPIIDFERYLDS